MTFEFTENLIYSKARYIADRVKGLGSVTVAIVAGEIKLFKDNDPILKKLYRCNRRDIVGCYSYGVKQKWIREDLIAELKSKRGYKLV